MLQTHSILQSRVLTVSKLSGAVSRLPLLRADPPAARGGEGGFPDGGQALAVREGDHAAYRVR